MKTPEKFFRLLSLFLVIISVTLLTYLRIGPFRDWRYFSLESWATRATPVAYALGFLGWVIWIVAIICLRVIIYPHQ